MEKYYQVNTYKDLEKFYHTAGGYLYVMPPKDDTLYVVEGYSLDECKMALTNGAYFYFITGVCPLDDIKEYEIEKVAKLSFT